MKILWYIDLKYIVRFIGWKIGKKMYAVNLWASRFERRLRKSVIYRTAIVKFANVHYSDGNYCIFNPHTSVHHH